MEKKQILIVEDERIVAEDLRADLQGLGYHITAIASTGEDAIKKVNENNPDLILMDINLKGDMDGIEAADQIRSSYDIPIVYLTAYADENTIERAKLTDPFGYIIKPFDDRSLHVNIEMSLYKHKMEKKLKESEKWFSTTLLSINDAVIATDRNGLVTFMNPVAEKLTGWKRENTYGNSLDRVFNVISEETRKQIENPAARVLLGDSNIRSTNDAVLISRDNIKYPIEENTSAIKDDNGKIIGTVLVFRDITKRKEAESVLKQQKEDLERANIELKRAFDGLLKRVDQKNKPISSKAAKIKSENQGAVFLFSMGYEESAHSIFVSIFDAGFPTLAVVRTPPDRFCQILKRDVETIWLTANRVSDIVCLDPSNITRLSMVLTEFFKHAPNGFVLFEGVEYLLSIVGFKDLLNLIQLLNDKIALNEGTIYMVLDLGVLDEKEARHIQRECLQPTMNEKSDG